MTKPQQGYLAAALTVAAGSVGDSFTAAGLDSQEFAFTIVLWPVGMPQNCSTVCGCGDPSAQVESTLALAAASEKAKRKPTHITNHRSGRPH